MADYTSMNALMDKFAPRGFAVLGCPCNQFGHQENGKNEEILAMLKHIRPGGGFEPNFDLTEKMEVNGANEHALWKWLKKSLPMPYDETELPGARQGSTADEWISNDGGAILWTPVRRSDVSWNFEKFLVAPDGSPFRRYSRFYKTADIEQDIEHLLSL